MTLLREPWPTVHTYEGDDACQTCGGSPTIHSIRPARLTRPRSANTYRCAHCPCREYVGPSESPRAVNLGGVAHVLKP